MHPCFHGETPLFLAEKPPCFTIKIQILVVDHVLVVFSRFDCYIMHIMPHHYILLLSNPLLTVKICLCVINPPFLSPHILTYLHISPVSVCSTPYFGLGSPTVLLQPTCLVVKAPHHINPIRLQIFCGIGSRPHSDQGLFFSERPPHGGVMVALKMVKNTVFYSVL